MSRTVLPVGVLAISPGTSLTRAHCPKRWVGRRRLLWQKVYGRFTHGSKAASDRRATTARLWHDARRPHQSQLGLQRQHLFRLPIPSPSARTWNLGALFERGWSQDLAARRSYVRPVSR